MAPAPAPSAGGMFTHKVGPFPLWVWLVVGGGVLYVYRKSTSGSSSSTAAQNAATLAAAGNVTPQTETITTPGGTYTGPAGGAPSSIYNPSSGVATSTPGGASGPAVGAYSGSGFLPPGAAAADIGTNPGTMTATDQTGSTYLWLNPAEAQSVLAQGNNTPLYFEPTPGQFAQVQPGNKGLASNTPLYVKQGS